MLTVTQAQDTMLQHASVLTRQSFSLQDSLNHVLAADLLTPHDSPPFDKSMMDGFVVNSQQVFSEGTGRLRVLETITAGTLPQARPGAGSASRIMTGAPLPADGDCVIPIEHTEFDEQQPDVVSIPVEHVVAERHVLRQGASVETGQPLLPAGTLLRPRHVAVLAEFGLATVPVVPAAEVAVLATGDELIPAAEPLTPGQIRNSNEPMLVAQIRRAGAKPAAMGIARDNEADLAAAIQRGLQHDVLLLSGGVSAGTLDLVPSQLQAAGVKQVFHKVQMKPGKPLWFGISEQPQHRCLVIGLPGNPVSSMVCFEVFVRPVIEQLAGRLPGGQRRRHGILTQDLSLRGDRPVFFPSEIDTTQSSVRVTPVPWGGSADLRSTALASGVAILQPKQGGYTSGTEVPVLCWDI